MVLLAALELLLALTIILTSVLSSFRLAPDEDSEGRRYMWLEISFIAKVGLAMLHGVLSTHFLTSMPSMAQVARNEQPRAYMQRDFFKRIGTSIGVIV